MSVRTRPLPIDDVVPQIVSALGDRGVVVVSAPPGAGKTTRIPSALLDSALARHGRVVVVQPRRLAARMCAQRIADERGCPLGEEVGYQVRFDKRAGRNTRLLIVTEGILLRMLCDDPYLERCAVVVFDEFHLRRLDTDLALAMIRRLRETVRPDLKVIVMSATIDTAAICRYWDQCPWVDRPVHTYPVTIEYWETTLPRDVADRACLGVEKLYARVRGDILVFLPGVGEIRRTERLLCERGLNNSAELLPLYADLDPAAQQAAVLPGRRRKIVLATNVAETSITIDGIEGVVDTGLCRSPVFDPAVGIERLETQWISRAAADQRAGRAGRTRPGVCLRMWSARSDMHRPEFDTPEILRMDLSGPLLHIFVWGEKAETLPWFEPPPHEAVCKAKELLADLGAIGADDRPTPLGRKLTLLPVHPRLGRIAHEAWRLGQPEVGAWTAALLSEQDPFERSAPGTTTGAPPTASASDVYDRVAALRHPDVVQQAMPWLGRLRHGAAQHIGKAARQLLREISAAWGEAPSPQCSEEEAVLRALVAGFPDRVVCRSAPGSRAGRMIGGIGVRLDDRSSVGDTMLYLAVNVDRGRSEALVRWASMLKRDWLPAHRLRIEVRTEFDARLKRVVARRCEFYEDLLIDQSPTNAPDDEAAKLLASAIHHAAIEEFFPPAESAADQFLARVRFLAQAMPELMLPVIDDVRLRSLAAELAVGRRSFEELREAPWLEALATLLSPEQRQTLDREAPARMLVPSGSRIPIKYQSGRPPTMAVRIQEMFGCRSTPRLAAGRVPVLLHLLGPNGRVEQITADLESFWRNTYHQVRKDLCRRYPKHAWPDDPLTARAERHPRRPNKAQ